MFQMEVFQTLVLPVRSFLHTGLVHFPVIVCVSPNLSMRLVLSDGFKGPQSELSGNHELNDGVTYHACREWVYLWYHDLHFGPGEYGLEMM